MSHVPSGAFPCRDNLLRETARSLLRTHAKDVLLYRTDERKNLLVLLSKVDHICCDIDGTLAEEGARRLPPRIMQYFHRLHEAGVAITLVSGKPYEEIMPLVRALPTAQQVRAIYEKGAYTLETSADGALSAAYLLGSPDLEQQTSALRRNLSRYWRDMEATHAREHISFGWAGSGKHRSLLSMDVFAGDVPSHYKQLIGSARDQLKLKNASTLLAIEAELHTFADVYCPGWNVMHLGNANFEITPPSIEKAAALRRVFELKQSSGVVVLGDSENDRSMFALRQHTNVAAGLVLHNPAAIELVLDVDFVTFGTANPCPLFGCLLEAKQRSR